MCLVIFIGSLPWLPNDRPPLTFWSLLFLLGGAFHRQPVSPETEMADVLDTDNYHGLRAGRDFPGLAR